MSLFMEMFPGSWIQFAPCQRVRRAWESSFPIPSLPSGGSLPMTNDEDIGYRWEEYKSLIPCRAPLLNQAKVETLLEITPILDSAPSKLGY